MLKKIKRQRRLQNQKRNIKKTKAIINWINGNNLSPQLKRGLEAEKKAFNALFSLREEKINFNDKVIDKIIETEHCSAEDLAGIDFIVIFDNKDKMLIQVKNHWSLAEQRKYSRKGICLIAIWPNEDQEKAKERTIQAISRFLDNNKQGS